MDYNFEDFLPLLSAGLGTGAQYLANKKQLDRRNALTNQMQAFQTAQANQGRAATQEYIAAQDPARQAAERTAIEQQLQDSLKTTMGGAQAYEKPLTYTAGKVTDRLTDARATGDAALRARLDAAMKQLAVINAPQQQRIADATRANDARSTVNASNSAIQRVGSTYQNAINMAQPNQFLDFTGQVLRGLAPALRPKKTAIGHAQNLGFAPNALPQE